MLMKFLSAFAEFERETISRVISGMHAKAAAFGHGWIGMTELVGDLRGRYVGLVEDRRDGTAKGVRSEAEVIRRV
jgi:DNA invertase Pin-like site-specific DNA recombinase